MADGQWPMADGRLFSARFHSVSCVLTPVSSRPPFSRSSVLFPKGKSGARSSSPARFDAATPALAGRHPPWGCPRRHLARCLAPPRRERWNVRRRWDAALEPGTPMSELLSEAKCSCRQRPRVWSSALSPWTGARPGTTSKRTCSGTHESAVSRIRRSLPNQGSTSLR